MFVLPVRGRRRHHQDSAVAAAAAAEEPRYTKDRQRQKEDAKGPHLVDQTRTSTCEERSVH